MTLDACRSLTNRAKLVLKPSNWMTGVTCEGRHRKESTNCFSLPLLTSEWSGRWTCQCCHQGAQRHQLSQQVNNYLLIPSLLGVSCVKIPLTPPTTPPFSYLPPPPPPSLSLSAQHSLALSKQCIYNWLLMCNFSFSEYC